MYKKAIIFLIINLPLNYLLYSAIGWGFYFAGNGDPTHLISYKILVVIIFLISVGLVLLLLKVLKLTKRWVILLSIVEVALVDFSITYYLIG